MERVSDKKLRQFAKENEPVKTTKRTIITIEELTMGFNFDNSVWNRYKKMLDEENERYYKNEMD